MEMFKKVMSIITNLVPRTTVRVTKKGGAYMIIIERSWLSRVVIVEVACKEALRTDMSLLDLL